MQDSLLQGAVEADESYFGAHCVRGKREQAPTAKLLCLVCLNVAARSTLKKSCRFAPERRCKVLSEAVSSRHCDSSDGWRGCGGLVDIGFDKHFRYITVKINCAK